MPQRPLKTQVIAAAHAEETAFAQVAGQFEDRGILNSEMLLACSLAAKRGVEVFIESGRWRGHSTQILAEYFADKPVKIESIELFRDANAKYVEQKMRSHTNVTLHYGDTNYVLPRLLKQHRHKKIALLFDGPKGQQAIDVFRFALTLSPTIDVAFFHDMRKPSPAMPNPEREKMEQTFPQAFFSDDKDFVKRFSGLDKSCQTELWRPHKIDNKPIGSYGPTLAAVVPSAADYAAAKRDYRQLWIAGQRQRLSSLAVKGYHIFRHSVGLKWLFP